MLSARKICSVTHLSLVSVVMVQLVLVMGFRRCKMEVPVGLLLRNLTPLLFNGKMEMRRGVGEIEARMKFSLKIT
jgi:hypothetical protein